MVLFVKTPIVSRTSDRQTLKTTQVIECQISFLYLHIQVVRPILISLFLDQSTKYIKVYRQRTVSNIYKYHM